MSRKILFFIETLCPGGKERRFVELMYYLKMTGDFTMQIVVMSDEIYYKYIFDTGIPITVLKRKGLKKDPGVFFRFYQIAKQFKPDIFHTWGTMTTFYAIPSKLLLKRPLIANLISNAKKDFGKLSVSNLLLKTCCRYSDKILANSEAGLKAYGINSQKSSVIHNGVRLERFGESVDACKIRTDFKINSKFIIIMVATFSNNKNYDIFLDVAKEFNSLQKDVTFLAVGDGKEFKKIKDRINNENITNVLLAGRQNKVENFIAASDIGVLFTNQSVHSEGISNSIIEYMALGKPVITTDIFGGSSEIISNNESGFILNEDVTVITTKINELLNNEKLRKTLGENGKRTVESKFSIDQMGKQFLEIYNC